MVNHGIGICKNYTFYSNGLIENTLLFINYLKFNIWFSDIGTRSEWRIQEDIKTSRKSNKDHKFPPLKCWKADEEWRDETLKLI